MLKVLYLPLNSPEGVQQGTYDAWENAGVQLEIFDFYLLFLDYKHYGTIRHKFLEKVRQFQPQLIHMQLQFTDIIDNATLMQARQLSPGVVITNWTGDIRATAIKNFISLSSALDYSLISSSGQLDLYKRAGCNNVKYWQIGYDPKNSYPKNYTEFKYDIGFIGNNYGKTFPDGPVRLEAAHKCHQHYGDKFGIFGFGYPEKFKAKSCSPLEANEIYNNSVASLSISNFNNVSHYFSDRLLYCMAAGRPTISWYFPGAESYFVEGSEIIYARSYADIIDAVSFCKKNPEKAAEIGMNGYKRAAREHTFTSRIIELLKITNLLDKV